MGVHFSKAARLFDARRPDLTEPLVRRDLTDDPRDARAQALLGLDLAGLKRPRETSDVATKAIRPSPDLPFCHDGLAAAIWRIVGLSAAFGLWFFLVSAILPRRLADRVRPRKMGEGLDSSPEGLGCP